MQSNINRAFLEQFSRALLKFHKSLIEAEKRQYELINGRVGSPGEFLNLLMEHKDFQWLRVISQLVAQIDQHIDDHEVLKDKDVDFFKKEFEKIEKTNDFSEKVDKLAKLDPDIMVAIVQIQAMLKKIH